MHGCSHLHHQLFLNTIFEELLWVDLDYPDQRALHHHHPLGEDGDVVRQLCHLSSTHCFYHVTSLTNENSARHA